MFVLIIVAVTAEKTMNRNTYVRILLTNCSIFILFNFTQKKEFVRFAKDPRHVHGAIVKGHNIVESALSPAEKREGEKKDSWRLRARINSRVQWFHTYFSLGRVIRTWTKLLSWVCACVCIYICLIVPIPMRKYARVYVSEKYVVCTS